MKTEQTKIVMFDSPEAAEYRTDISGWVSRNGKFYGKDERLARFDGSTHALCECGEIREKSYTVCPKCRNVKLSERYKAMPFKEWDRKTPLCLFNNDVFFWDQDEILDYIKEHEVKASDLMLVICEPQYMALVEVNYWEDVIPDNMDELPRDIQSALDALNAVIQLRNKNNPISWTEGKFRTEIFESLK